MKIDSERKKTKKKADERTLVQRLNVNKNNGQVYAILGTTATLRTAVNIFMSVELQRHSSGPRKLWRKRSIAGEGGGGALLYGPQKGRPTRPTSNPISPF